MMSSVGAVVNHESDDEYNPIRMLKTSIASTVQVRYLQLLFQILQKKFFSLLLTTPNPSKTVIKNGFKGCY